MSVLAELFRGGAGRRSIEHPSTPLSAMDDEIWDAMTGGEKADSGVKVNHKTALTYSAFWRGVNLISTDVAKTPLLVYSELTPGDKRKDKTHPAYRLLRRRANRYMKAFDLKKTIVAHALARGNGYAYIFRRGADPAELLLLDPAVTYPVRENGVLWYVTAVNLVDGKSGAAYTDQRKLRPEDVLHVKGLGYDGLVGYDVITFAKQSLGLGLALRKYGSIFFKNGASINVVLEHPGQLEEEAAERLRKSWASMHEGLDNAHRTAILEEGMKAHALTVDARKAQLMEMREFEIREIANFLGVPPHKLGDTTRTAFASLEQENQAYLDEALDGWFCQIEEECTDKLLSTDQKESETHYCEFLREALKRVDYKTQVEGMVMELNNGLLSPDEGRAARNRPPYPQGLGRKFRIPGNINVIEEPQEADAGAAAAQGAAEDLAFKREVVKAYIADGTISDVIFNLTAARELLESVNLPTQPDYQEPWLPVVAESGPLVSGDTITDPQGDVVGGAIAEQKSKSQNVETSKPGDGAADPEDDPDAVDLEDPAAVRAAFGRIVRTAATRARTQRRQTIGWADRAAREAWGRMTVRIAHQAERAAKKPGEFVAWVEGLEAEHRQAVIDAVTMPERARASMRGQSVDPAAMATNYFGWLRRELLTVAECKAAELPAAVRAWVASRTS